MNILKLPFNLIPLKLFVPIAKKFFSILKKTELDYDTGIFGRLWNVENVSAVLSTIIQL
jgi:hypothetical protein